MMAVVEFIKVDVRSNPDRILQEPQDWFRRGVKICVEVDNHDVMIRERVAGQRFLKPAFKNFTRGSSPIGTTPWVENANFPWVLLKASRRPSKLSKPCSIELGFFNRPATACSPQRAARAIPGNPSTPDSLRRRGSHWQFAIHLSLRPSYPSQQPLRSSG
jgi:hypothetical protein